MGAKRKYGEYKSFESKPWSSSAESRIDQQYGQHHALPGLDDSDHEYRDETSLEAIRYLKGVRAEAQSIPAVLQAHQEPPPETLTSNDCSLDVSKGLYADGAYFAITERDSEQYGLDSERFDYTEDDRNETTTELSSNGVSQHWLHAQDAYHTLLLERFQAVRSSYTSLGRSIPPNLPPSDSKSHPTSVDHQAPAATESAKWSYILQNTKPIARQLIAMPQDSILWLLDRLPLMIKRKKWMVEGGCHGQAMGLWAWSLLIRLDEPGTLSNEEVAIVRELGKRAAGIIKGMHGNHEHEWENEEQEKEKEKEGQELSPSDKAESDRGSINFHKSFEIGEQQSGDCSGINSAAISAEKDIKTAQRRVLGKIGSDLSADEESLEEATEKSSASLQSLQKEEIFVATLDMILTIIGEYYGQRDLLVARDRLWG